MVKLRASGRGRGYSAWRGLLESVLELLYRGDWPAHLWSTIPASRQVLVSRRSVTRSTSAGRACRVAFASDLHVGPTTPVSLLQAAFAAIQRERPDVLLLGGDFIFLEAVPSRLAVLRSLVESVSCPVKLAVLGNHDLWTADHAIVEALSNAGVTVLVNEAFPLPAPWSDVVVVGLDDPSTGRCDPAAAAAQLGGQPFRIVLCHSPDGLALLSGLQFNVFLAGHTHGGQIAAPWGPIVLPNGPMCGEYPSGFAQFGEGLVYVSRGVGTVELPIRSFAPPDILLLDLPTAPMAASEPRVTGCPNDGFTPS
jgi:predicted MPP superfamily phosphohydrolase